MIFKRKGIFTLLVLSIILLLIAISAPASAVAMHVDLGKTYDFRNANLRYIDVIDIGDLSQSRLEVQTTTGGDDIKIIHTPTIRWVERNFSSMDGYFNKVHINITGNPVTIVDYTTKPDFFRVYIKPVVPTFDVAVPTHAGNPVIIKYNESWSKGDMSSLDAFLRSSEFAYLYYNDSTDSGVAYLNSSIGDTYASYAWPELLFDGKIKMNNITATLLQTKVSLDPFIADREKSEGLGYYTPVSLPSRGKYYALALEHDQEKSTMNVYAVSPVIILELDNPDLLWNGEWDPSPYNNLTGSDVVLSFNGDYLLTEDIQNVTYLLINKDATYDMAVRIDTELLAQHAEDRWSVFSSGTHISELLYEGIRNDIGAPFTYTITADGQPAPAPATNWSKIPISAGYGISGNNSGYSVTIPEADMHTLLEGTYYIYLMGTDINNDVIGFDQQEVVVTGGAPIPGTNISINVRNISGFYNAEITLKNETWSTNKPDADYLDSRIDLPVGSLAPGEYTVIVNDTVFNLGYRNVTANISVVTGQDPRVVDITLYKLGELTTPRLVLSENNTVISFIEQNYTAPTGWKKFDVPNRTRETFYYNVTISGNDTVAVGVEYPKRLTIHAPNVTMDGQPLDYDFVNGNFSVVFSTRLYTSTNATILVHGKPDSDGKVIRIRLDGTLLGDADNDGVISMGDVSFARASYARKPAFFPLPTFDYGDVYHGGLIDMSSVSGIRGSFAGKLNY